MINKTDIINFFDSMAPSWDAGMVRNEKVIKTILDNAGVREGIKILDVACGTGVLIPDYLERNVASVTGIDISPMMISIAEQKFSQSNVRFICGDAEIIDLNEKYDVIVIYNALPHFTDPEKLITNLSRFLNPGGTLTVAHGRSRERVNAHHSGSARKVSLGLMEADELAAIFSKALAVTKIVSDDEMYQVVGSKRV